MLKLTGACTKIGFRTLCHDHQNAWAFESDVSSLSQISPIRPSLLFGKRITSTTSSRSAIVLFSVPDTHIIAPSLLTKR